jgi:pyruvate/2-oxoglutarate dehydrogenase complex dihydrolipoamide acyltransferase (E2) component
MPETIQVAIPRETVNDETVRILAWSVLSGALVEKNQLLCEVETSKAVMEIHAPEAGMLRYHANVGEEVPVGSVLCEILSQAQGEALLVSPTDTALAETETRRPAARLTPLARRIAADLGIDPSVFASGMLVRSSDVLRKAGKSVPAIQKKRTSIASPQRSDSAQENAPVAGVPLEWIELPRRKMIESRILAAGQAASIPSSVTSTCHAAKLLDRTDDPKRSPLHATALILFESARLLRKYPMFNAVFDRGRAAQYQEINVGWAIDGGEGLVVPVIKQAEKKGLAEITAAMEQQLEAYVGKSLTPDDFLGGTFTISDLSADGVSFFQPLLSQGQSAILGVGSDPPTEARRSLYLTVAFDHQLAEGRSAAHFLRDLGERLEAHASLERPVETDRFCVLCQRDEAALKGKAILVKSYVPPGSVCSVCLAGY